jgi:hypothetical protein
MVVPLARMLSAMRELILDGPLPSGELALRRETLAGRFPDLDRTEIDDLAAIPPDRIRVYTRLIFNGERATLRWAFPMSLAAIHRLLAITEDAGAADFELVRDLHRHRPWHSTSHRELAANFQDYTAHDRADLRARWSGLLDLVDYERTEVDIFYAADVPHAACEVERLAALTVGELMAVPVVRPPYSALRSFGFDVPALAARWRRDQTLPDPLPPPVQTLAAAGRSPSALEPAWVCLSPAMHAALQRIESGGTARVNEVATAFLDAPPVGRSTDEAQVFARFFDELRRCFSGGVLLRATA